MKSNLSLNGLSVVLVAIASICIVAFSSIAQAEDEPKDDYAIQCVAAVE